MPPYTEEHNNIRQYLLGNLSEETRRQAEERLLTETSFLEELLSIEEELIDDYVQDELSADDRLRFEQYFLSTPERQQKLRFALALGRYTSTSAEKPASESTLAQSTASPIVPTWKERLRAFWNGRNRTLSVAVACGVVAVVAGALWLSFFRTSSPRNFIALTLTISNSNRAEGPQARKVKLTGNPDALKISLMLPEGATSAARYRVELENDDREIKPLQIAGQDAQSVMVVIPARELSRGRYALNLFMTKAGGTEQPINGSYFFDVE